MNKGNEMKQMFLTIMILCFSTNTAFGAASLRIPKTSNSAQITPIQQTGTSTRAGTLRTKSVNSASLTTDTPQQPETNGGRLASLKSVKGLNPNKVKDTNTAQQELNAIDSRIEELRSQLDRAEAAQNTVITESNIDEKVTTNIESKTYTKEEIDNLLSDIIQKVPQVDDRGTAPNDNPIAIPEGAVVIGGNDIVIVDGILSTTSKHPIQNQTVTNAINEKQNKSMTLSLGGPNGEWTPVAIGSDYIELYTNPMGAKEIRIRPSMIATSLDNMENEDQLITAGAVRDALNALATNSGNGTQQEPYFNLINLQTLHGGLVQRYTYETNASESQILNFALNSCGGTFSDRWCTLYENDGHIFKIVKRQEGHVLEDTMFLDTNTVSMMYAVNLPDDVTPQTYVNTHLCANRSNTCYMNYSWYSGTNGFDFNAGLEPLFFIAISIE